MDFLSSLSVFIRVAETGSFTKAADSLGVNRSHVTRRVQELEEDLGTRLFFRSTREVTLTSEGEVLLERGRELLFQSSSLYAAVRDLAGKPLSGMLRIASSVVIGWVFLQQLAEEFLDAHPDVRLEMVTEDQEMNMIEEGVDIAFRVGHEMPPSYVAKRLGTVRNVFCAAPGYLKTVPPVSGPKDLERVEFLVNTYLGSKLRLTSATGEKASVEVHGRFVSRNTFINARACLEGRGVAMLPLEYAQPYVERDELVRLLPGWEGEPYGFFALYPDRAMSRTAREFLALVESRLRSYEGRVYYPMLEGIRMPTEPIHGTTRKNPAPGV